MSSLIHRIADAFSCLQRDAYRRNTQRRSTIESLETRTLLTVNLVADINSLTSPSATPSNFTEVNGAVFFTAAIGQSGLELWKTDGTSAGTVLVKDIISGSTGSRPDILTNVNGTLYFRANDGVNGYELWKSDGTSAGTVMVKDIRSGSSSGYPANLTNVNGTLYFSANDGVNGVELWKTDGTTEGTVLVKDIRSGGPFTSSYPSYLTNMNGTLYFRAIGGSDYGLELWRTNGTSAGTVLVKDIRSGSGSSAPRHLTNVNGTLYFRADDGVNGNELWKSDGTAAGTVLVKDIRSGNNSSYPTYLTDVNGTLYFRADDGVSGIELWKTDGTTEGTMLVKDIRSGSSSSSPNNLKYVGLRSIELQSGTLYFSANDGVNGDELWKSDGTPVGTVLVKDINSGSFNSAPKNLTNLNGTLYFQAGNSTNGTELWKSDGTEAGTQLVANIGPGSQGSNPSNLTVVGNQLYFTTLTPQFGDQLYRYSENSPPTNIVLSISSIRENAGENAFIGNLSGVDPDLGDTITFSLPPGLGNNNFFNLSGTSLRANDSFDFESRSNYSITVRATDALGLTFDKAFAITVTNVTELGAIDVQSGQTQRSFVRYLDLIFDSNMGLLDLINSPRLQLTRFDLNGANGVVIPLPGGAGTSVSGNQINVDFGAQGIGGNRNSAVGDGFYKIGVDLDGNGSFETTRNFFRLFGDVTGDGTVNSADKIQVLQANGTRSAESDVNGDELHVVDVLDTALMSRAIGKKIKHGLFWDD